MVLLQADGVHAQQAGREVLKAVSLCVGRGELWGVLGPNGAGKSTFLRVLLGLLPFSRGEVRCGGRPLQSLSPKERARELGWVPQTFDASIGFTGLELVLMGRSPHLGPLTLAGESDVKAARAVLEELGLEALASRRTDALSGGEVRLLLLARALLQAPRVLLLDEPTAFLDVHHQVKTLEAVKRRVRTGLAAVAVLHDVNLAAAYVDRVLLLRGGEVLAAGAPREVLTTEKLESLYGVQMQQGLTSEGARLFTPRAAGA